MRIELLDIYGHWNAVYRMHLRWAKRGLWPRILQIVAGGGMRNGLLSLDATFVKAHKDTCRLGGNPEKQGLAKTKGGRNSMLDAQHFTEEEAMRGRVVQTVRCDVWRPNGRLSTSLPPDSPMAQLRYGKLTQRLRDLIGHK